MPRTGARDWDPQVMIRLITPERMSTYLDACSGDIDDAFTLYRRNIDIASSIQAITAMVEVVSRNAIDRALTGYVAHTGQVDDWFDLPVLDAKAQDDIRVARQRVRLQVTVLIILISWLSFLSGSGASLLQSVT